MQQLAIEGLVLSAIASALGMGLAMLMLKLFEHGLTTQFHIHEKMVANLSVIGLLVGLTMASALLCSVWPAIAAARASISRRCDRALRRIQAVRTIGRGLRSWWCSLRCR